MCILIIFSYLSLHLLDAFDVTEYNTDNLVLLDEFSVKEVKKSTSHSLSDQWSTDAVKDIGYYLRDHKFNEWDRRYYQDKPNKKFIGFFSTFPHPPLRTLHWEVKANCQEDFYTCISYLHTIVETAPYSRVEDTAVILNGNVSQISKKMIKRFDLECREKHIYAQKIGLPFDDPIEKFQWRTTASYYMCWYTMLGTPALSMLGESCDNFASCLDSEFSNHNYDPRADDKFSFDCAMYSFCPDPCCPKKHIESASICINEDINPCFVENTERDYFQRICRMDRKLNQNFEDIVNNKLNVSCQCSEGFKWETKFGICVDINECILGTHHCDNVSQHCLNLPGTYLCTCEWGFDLDNDEKVCLKRKSTLWS